MKTEFKPVKLLPVWLAVSAVLLVAGIILASVLGFNLTPEEGKIKTFEVDYDVVAETAYDPADIEKACEDAFKANGLNYLKKETDTATLLADGKKLVYTFSYKAEDEALTAALTAAKAAFGEKLPEAQIYANFHTAENKAMNEAVWRGAIALCCGAIVGMVYVLIRFGVAAALTGLTLEVHGAGIAATIFAITRIPVTAGGPLLYAGIAAVTVLILWILYCMKMRESSKEPDYAALSTDERVENAFRASWRLIACVAGGIGAAVVLLGACATAGVRLLVLPALLPLAVAVYSVLFFGPALHVYVKRPFDRMSVKRKRYTGKKKAEKAPDEG